MEKCFMTTIAIITFASFTPVTIIPSFPPALNAPTNTSAPSASLTPDFLIPAISDTWDLNEILNYKIAYRKKKGIPVSYYFTKKGIIKKYSYPTIKYNTNYLDEISAIISKPVFTCGCCGEKVTINNIEEYRLENEKIKEKIISGKAICSNCYEDSMGEDL